MRGVRAKALRKLAFAMAEPQQNGKLSQLIGWGSKRWRGPRAEWLGYRRIYQDSKKIFRGGPR